MQANKASAPKAPKPKQAQKPKKQPRQVNVAGPRRDIVTAAPARIGESLRSYFHVDASSSAKYKNAIRVRGQDFLGVLSVVNNDAVGVIAKEIYICPEELGPSRLSQFAKLYEKYLFTKMAIKYAPDVGTSVNGSVVIAPDRDISDVVSGAGEDVLRQVTAYEGAIQTQYCFPAVCRADLEAPESGFYTNPNGVEDRLAYQGQIYLVTSSPATNSSGTALTAGSALGKIWIEYECLFFVPQLELAPVSDVFVGGGINPTGADALLPFAPQSVPTAGANNTALPILNPAGATGTTIRLAEGLYRMLQTSKQNAAGAVQFNAPTITPSIPAAASAPQPQQKTLASANANASGNTAFFETLLNIPKDGALLTQTMANVGGLASAAVNTLNLCRVGGYVSSGTFDGLFV